LSRITTGKPKARPRGRPFPKGVSGNPGGRPAQGPDRRKIEADAGLLARSCGPEAVEELRTIMKDPAAPYMAKIIAATACLTEVGAGRRYRLRCMRPLRGRRSVREAPVRLSKAALLSLAPDYEQRKILPSS